MDLFCTMFYLRWNRARTLSLAVRDNQLTLLPPTLTRLSRGCLRKKLNKPLLLFLLLFSQFEFSLWTGDNPLPEEYAADIAYLLAATQSLLQRIGQRFSYYGARNAAVAFMMVLAGHRFRRAATVWNEQGKTSFFMSLLRCPCARRGWP